MSLCRSFVLEETLLHCQLFFSLCISWSGSTAIFYFFFIFCTCGYFFSWIYLLEEFDKLLYTEKRGLVYVVVTIPIIFESNHVQLLYEEDSTSKKGTQTTSHQLFVELAFIRKVPWRREVLQSVDVTSWIYAIWPPHIGCTDVNQNMDRCRCHCLDYTTLDVAVWGRASRVCNRRPESSWKETTSKLYVKETVSASSPWYRWITE